MKTIFYDVDTQNDFMNKNGALYVPNAELIKTNLAKLTRYACEQGIPIFGSVDRHFGTPEYKEREAELTQNGGPFPNHCMDKTDGQLKIKETEMCAELTTVYEVNTGFINNPLTGKAVYLHTKEGKICLERRKTLHQSAILAYKDITAFIKKNISWKCSDPFAFRIESEEFMTSGIFFEKQHYDVATNPWFEKVMQAISPERAIVYGVATDYCVKAGALTLRKIGVPEVYVVTDTIRGITPEGSKKALEEMIEAGVKLTTLEDVLRGKRK